ncbi:MAG: efflux RND transporter periplasmic adaptor subunit [Gammaproteobacteria bacterium]
MNSPGLFAAFSTVALTCVMALTGCREAEPDARQLPPRVVIARAAPAAQPARSFTGIVVPRVQSDLGFRVAGKVIARLVDRGQTVKRGQALMRIDIADLALTSQARSEAVRALQARAAQTASDERRYRGLVKHGAISALAYEQSQSAAAAAAAELHAAEAQAAVARNETRYAVLAADADGVVVDTLAEPGQVVAAGQPVIRLAHAGPREARIDLPETFRPALGSSATAERYGMEGGRGLATLRELSQSADPVSRTFEARYTLSEAAADAPLGSTITLQIPDPDGVATMEVPLSALADNGSGSGVWIIERADPHALEATTTWRPVSVAGLSEESAVLSAGLAAGEPFVAMGAHMLRPGTRVRLSEDVAATVTQDAAR